MLLFIRTSQAKPNPNHNNTITHGLNRNVPLMPCNAPDNFVYNAV